jgi:hypothetical protein
MSDMHSAEYLAGTKMPVDRSKAGEEAVFGVHGI